jgi:surface antigen
MRPDIWNDRAPPSIDPLNDWDAWTWVQHAQAEGLSVTGDPQPGDVMVYSRAAVGNNTGHVAIVDAVGGIDPATGDLEVTVSEMNVDGLDDASVGQGDTMTVLLPRSELVPGMIQFIHEPGPSYTPPAWPGASSPGDPGPAAPPATPQNPSLGVGLFGNHVQTVSQSPAPVQATVTSLPGGTVIKRVSFAANRDVALDLPTGTYQVCVSQAAAGPWAAVGDCASGSWQAPPVRATIRLGAIRSTGRRLTLAVVLGPGAFLNGDAALTARILVSVDRPARRGHRAVTAGATYRVTSHLHAGRQVVALPVKSSSVRHAVLSVTVAAVSADGTAMGSARASVHLR